MMVPSWTAGESIAVALDVLPGSVGVVSGVQVLAHRPTKPSVPGISFTVTARAASGDVPAGWDITRSAGIDVPGNYLLEARLSVGGDVIDMDPPLAFSIVRSPFE